MTARGQSALPGVPAQLALLHGGKHRGVPVKATGPSVSRSSLLPCFSVPYFQLCATDEGSELCCNAPRLSLGQEGTASCGQATGRKGRERSNQCPHSTVSTRQGPFEFTFESKCCISKHDALIKPSTPLIKTEYWCFPCGGQGNLDKGQVSWHRSYVLQNAPCAGHSWCPLGHSQQHFPQAAKYQHFIYCSHLHDFPRFVFQLNQILHPNTQR